MRKIQSKYRNLLISLVITGVLIALSYLFFYPDHSGLGKGFTVAVLYMIVRYVVLYAGIIVLLARVVRLWKNTGNIPYVFLGTVNFLVGALCLILYSIRLADTPWLHKCLINLLVGTILIADAFVFKNQPDTSNKHDDS